MRRRILFPAFFYASGILTYISISDRINYFLIGLTIASLFLVTVYLKNTFKIKVSFLICFFILAIFNSYVTYHYSFGNLEKYQDGSHEFLISIDKIQKKDGYISTEGKLLNLDNQKMDSEKILVNIYYETVPNLSLDDTISVTGTIEKPKPNTNPHCFNYRNYLLSLGIKYSLYANGYKVVSQGKSIRGKLYQLKEKYLTILEEKLTKKETAFIKGVCFGDKSDIDENDLRSYRENGTGHILAVSGLHIGMIYALIQRLLYKKNRLLFYISLIVVLVSYGIITQWSVSVLRASLLIGTRCLAFLLEKRYDLTSATAFVGLILLFQNPFQILGVGFQMSFLAVLCLAFLAPKIRICLEKWTKKDMPGISTVLAIQIGVGIFSSYLFNYFAPLSFLLNIPIVMLVSYLVPLVLLEFLIFSLFNMAPMGKVIGLLADIIDFINRTMWADGKTISDMQSVRSIVIGLFIMILFLCFSEQMDIWRSRKQKKTITITVLMLIIISIPLFYNHDDRFNKADLIFVDVSQGDCLHIRSEGDDYLFDGGGKEGYDVGKNTLKPYLLKNGAKSIKGAFVTHNHMDHFEGLCQLSKEFKIEKGFISSGYTEVAMQVGEKFYCEDLYYINDQNTITLSKDRYIEVLWPQKGAQMLKEDDENSVSLVFMIHYDGIKILITGDIDSQCEEILVEKYRGTNKLEADILKVGHHGSKYSSSESFLEQVKPKLSIISVGKNNYGHPSKEVIDRLEKMGSRVYRTDKDGAIGIIIKRNSLKVLTQLGQ